MKDTIKAIKEHLVKKGIDERTSVVVFDNAVQKALWDQELTGQFSDGYWENSPIDWRTWTSLHSTTTDEIGVNPGVYFMNWSDKFRAQRNYQVYNTELLKYVGDRMFTIAKAAAITNNPEIRASWMSVDGLYVPRVAKQTKTVKPEEICETADWYIEKDLAYRIKDFTGEDGKVDCEYWADVLNSEDYTLRDFRKDLTRIDEIMRTKKDLS